MSQDTRNHSGFLQRISLACHLKLSMLSCKCIVIDEYMINTLFMSIFIILFLSIGELIQQGVLISTNPCKYIYNQSICYYYSHK